MTQADSTASIHGHEVLHLIMAHEPSRESLRQMIHERYGTNARFHTCSAAELDLDDLLTFLVERDKIVERTGCLIADPAKMCDHG